MRTQIRSLATLAFFGCTAIAAAAQGKPPLETVTFAGGEITIAENDDYEKIVTFNGRELGRDFYAHLNRVVTIGDTDVALVSLGPGGNACSGYTMIIWPDGTGGVETAMPEDTCQSPEPAVTDYAIYFVPYVGPGEEMPVRRWTPADGFATAGIIRFSPEPGTVWADLAATPPNHPLDFSPTQSFTISLRGPLETR